MSKPKLKKKKVVFSNTFCICDKKLAKGEYAFFVGHSRGYCEECGQKHLEMVLRVANKRYKKIAKEGGKVGGYHGDLKTGRVIRSTNSV